MATVERSEMSRGSRPIPDPTLLTTQQLLREMQNLKEVVFTRLDGMDRAMVVFSDNLTRAPTEVDKQIGHLKELTEKTVSERFGSVQTQFNERDLRNRQAALDNLAAMSSTRDVIQTRLDGMDKAIELLQTSTDRIPESVTTVVAQLQQLHDERFHSIQLQFTERDTRTEQTSKDSKVAVDAALQAAKEAVEKQNASSALAIAKSEAATMKQMDQIGAIISANSKNMDDKLDDLKARLTTIEGRASVSDPAMGEAVRGLADTVRELKSGENRSAGQAQGVNAAWGFIVGGVGLLVGLAALASAFRPH
jgi:hypothetical protein